jgi:hypothetical protein
VDLSIESNVNDEEIWRAAVIISLGRIYDLHLCILSKLDETLSHEVLEMHTKGELFFPPPAYIGEDDENNTTGS